MQKIKILHIIKSLGRGGAETLLPETLKLHDTSKFEFHYIYFLPWKDQMVESLVSNGGKVTCISSKNNLDLIFKTSKVISYVKRNDINLIHCHLPWSGFLGRLVYRKTKIPVIYTEHNIQERYHTVTKYLNRFSFNFQSLALGVSKDVTRSIVENIKPNIPVNTLLNGVSTTKFTFNKQKREIIRDQFNIPKDAFVIGNIAVFRSQKNLEVWLKAFKVASTRNSEIYGILVGAGPMESDIKALVSELGLNEKVKLPGLQTDTVSYFSTMDVFMMSSDFEGLPIALLEAMSMNCAIISTKAGGVVEVIRDGEDGLLCNIGDWECLGSKIIELKDNSAKFQELKLASRERVESNFSLDNMVKKLEEYYLKTSRK